MTEERKRMSVQQIVSAALELPEEDREKIIAHLDAYRSRPSAIREAWIEEADRRMELVRAGKMRLIDAEEVLADAEIEAVLADLPEELYEELLDRVSIRRGMSPDTEQSWLDEVQRRVAEYDAGEVEGIPMEVTLAKLRAMLR